MKTRLLMLSMLLLGVVACQNDLANVDTLNAEVDFQLAISAEEPDDTRAGNDGEDDLTAAKNSAYGAIDYLQTTDWTTADLRYTLEIYDYDESKAYGSDFAPIKDRQVIIVDAYTPVVFDLRIIPNRDYCFAVFADFVKEGSAALSENEQRLLGDGLHHRIGATLKDITIINDGINEELTDAYFGTKKIRVTNSESQDIVLKRPYGKLRVIATDLHEVNINLHPASVDVTYSATHPTALNVLTGAIDAENVTTSQTFHADYVANLRDALFSEGHLYNDGFDAKDEYTYTNDNGITRKSHVTLFTDYILGDDEQRVVHFNMDVKDQTGTTIKATEFNTDIPIQRNYLTTIIGNVLTTATEIEVRIDDNFADEIIEEVEDEDDDEGEQPADKPANNEIWYTSSDNQVVAPVSRDAFGANIISNTYADGKGVITFDGDITEIGENAFYICTNLTNITIPNSVKTIGDSAFYYCTSLTSVTIPDSVTTIGDSAFYYCTSLTSVTIPDSVTTIGSYAFQNCKSLSNITIPDSVKTIGVQAFCFCESLTSVTIPDSVTTIGDRAFFGCTSLTNITIPDSVTTIGDYAFYNCTSLTNITIPDSVKTIGDYAFENCTSLISVTIPNSVTTIGNRAFFGCSSLTNITIPYSVTTIGVEAFFDCTSLISITIPDSVTTIGDYTFYKCTSLTNITIPDSVKTIGDYAFAYCYNLTSVTIPNSVTTIGNRAFYKCTSLTNITIPDSVKTIGNYTFYNCTSLTSVYCKATTPSALGGGVFYENASDRKIYVPAGSGDEYKAAWPEYADAIVEEGF